MGKRLLLHLFFLLLCRTGALSQSAEFTENKGQWDTRILYQAEIPAGRLYLEKKGFTYLFYNEKQAAPYLEHGRNRKPLPAKFTLDYQVIRIEALHSNAAPVMEPVWEQQGYKNYFLGSDPRQWASHVRSFQKIRYKDLYPGIDYEIYSQQNGLKYDVVVHPGADAAQVQMRYRGAEKLFINDGKLFIQTSFHTLTEEKPYAYQWIGEQKVEVDCAFQLDGTVLSFRVGQYNKDLPLVIDPVLVFATYSGTTVDNFGFTATYDARGNLYAGGNVTFPSPPDQGRYPATTGAFQVNFAGRTSSSGPYSHFPCDMAISKYDSSGNTLIWATYLGGTNNDYPHSLVADGSNRLVILGSTYSKDFPYKSTSYDTSFNGGADIVVVKLSANADSLIGSTFLGGTDDDGITGGVLVYHYADDFRGDVFIGDEEKIIIASSTRSTDYPLQGTPLQNANRGGYDGVISILDSSLVNLEWSTYIGGSGDDALYSIKLTRNQQIVAGGGTRSNDLVVAGDPYQQNFAGGSSDGFVLSISDTSKKLYALTYLGTSHFDQVYFVDVDLKGHVYAYGLTEGNFPKTAGTYGQQNNGQFIVKMDVELDTLLFSTTIGSRVNNPNLSPTAFLVDNCYNIYFAGWGSDVASPTQHVGSTTGLQIMPGAIQTVTDGNDFYLGVMSKDAASLIYSTFFGGTQTDDHVDGGTSRFDKRGIVYHAICGSCPGLRSAASMVSDISTTPGSAFPLNTSPRCSNATFKLDFQITYAVESRLAATPRIGCLPLTVDFTNKSLGGTNFRWDFGDGTSDTTQNPTHVYTQAGTYTAWLKVLDSVSCNLTDSVYVTIRVLDHSLPEFDFEQGGCSREVTFSNTSSAALSFLWKFSDGTSSTQRDPKKEFPAYGTYEVTLISNPGTVCMDSVTKSVTLTDVTNQPLKIANAFTPGGDNINDCYAFDGLSACDEVDIQVFNRWAMKVYETTQWDFCWDGTDYKSKKPLADGTYYIVAKIRQQGREEVEYKGTIKLIRAQ